MSGEFISFEVWGEYANFRKGYTTTSSLSYPIPPKTAIIGLISAILGIDREELPSYRKILSRARVSILNLGRIKMVKVPQNFVNTKVGMYLWDIPNKESPRTQIPVEYLRKPKYRIFVSLPRLSDRLESMLKEHKSVFTPYLGTSECIANFSFLGKFRGEEIEADDIEVRSVVRRDACKIVWEEDKAYHIVKLPAEMGEDRRLIKTVDLVYEENGKPIRVRSGKLIYLRGYGPICVF